MDDKVKAWEPYFGKPCAVQLMAPLVIVDLAKDQTTLEPIKLKGDDGESYGGPGGGEMPVQQVIFGALRAGPSPSLIELCFKVEGGATARVAVRPDHIAFVTLLVDVIDTRRIVM